MSTNDVTFSLTHLRHTETNKQKTNILILLMQNLIFWRANHKQCLFFKEKSVTTAGLNDCIIMLVKEFTCSPDLSPIGNSCQIKKKKT